jgi:hypothetical protein
MALKEKVKFQLLVDPDDPSTLILKPLVFHTAEMGTGLKPGSIYTINLKDIKFTDNSSYSNKEEFITKPDSYMFVDINDVKELIYGLDVPDESILRHINEASKTAMYWAKINVDANTELPDFNSETFQEDYYPFYMFIKHTAMAECIKEYYIELISGPKKWKDTLSDLGREEEMDFNALKRLMDDLEHEADEWLELVVTITADPKWALRGKYSYAVYNTYCKPYHAISWYKNDYSRGF